MHSSHARTSGTCRSSLTALLPPLASDRPSPTSPSSSRLAWGATCAQVSARLEVQRVTVNTFSPILKLSTGTVGSLDGAAARCSGHPAHTTPCGTQHQRRWTRSFKAARACGSGLRMQHEMRVRAASRLNNNNTTPPHHKRPVSRPKTHQYMSPRPSTPQSRTLERADSMVKVNSEPWPSVDSTQISPP